MSILDAFAEDLDFPNGLKPAVFTTAGMFRANYARCGVGTDAAGSGIVKSTPFPGGEVTDVWMHFRWYHTDGSANWLRIGLGKSGTSKGIILGTAASLNKLGVYTYDGTTQTLLASESGTSVDRYALYKIDFQLTDFGSGSHVCIYVDDVLVIDEDVDTSLSGVSGLDSVFFCQCAGGIYNSYSEIIIADEDTRKLEMVVHYATADGDTVDWNGAYGAIDETSMSDADTIDTNTAAKDAQFAMSNLPTGNWNVKSVKVAARTCKTSDASIATLKLGILSGGTADLDSGQTVAAGRWQTLARLATTINGGAMSPAGLDAMQLNLKSAV